MTEETTTRTAPLPKYAWALLLLLPVALVVPWVFILLVPLLILGAAFHLGWFGLKRSWKEDAPDGPVDVLMVRGLESSPELESGLRGDLDALFSDTPSSADPVACACVKRAGNEYVGVVRTRTRDGYTFARSAGASPEEVGGQLRDIVKRYGVAPPETTPEADPHHECDSAGCPLGRKSIFYVNRDEVGRPRMQEPRD